MPHRTSLLPPLPAPWRGCFFALLRRLPRVAVSRSKKPATPSARRLPKVTVTTWVALATVPSTAPKGRRQSPSLTSAAPLPNTPKGRVWSVLLSASGQSLHPHRGCSTTQMPRYTCDYPSGIITGSEYRVLYIPLSFVYTEHPAGTTARLRHVASQQARFVRDYRAPSARGFPPKQRS